MAIFECKAQGCKLRLYTWIFQWLYVQIGLVLSFIGVSFTEWKFSKYGVISGP